MVKKLKVNREKDVYQYDNCKCEFPEEESCAYWYKTDKNWKEVRNFDFKDWLAGPGLTDKLSGKEQYQSPTIEIKEFEPDLFTIFKVEQYKDEQIINTKYYVKS